MPNEQQQPSSRQVTNGNNNVQIVGDGNLVYKEVDDHSPEEVEQVDGFIENNAVNPSITSYLSNFIQNVTGNFNVQILGNNNIVKIFVWIRKYLLDPDHTRKRQDLLKKVETVWINKPLDEALHNGVLIGLEMIENPDAVVNLHREKQLTTIDKDTLDLPASTPILQIFDEMEHAMLILGEPGSGKTTMLLELGRNCIDRAKKDHTQPVPIYLNLSWWNNAKQSFAEWIVYELITSYRISKDDASSLVKNDGLLLLLDGLDEVDIGQRNVCVHLINKYRNEHASTYLLICSRITDYEVLKTKLNLQGAIVLQPLTSKQIDEYFEHLGAKSKNVYQILKSDEQLQQLASLPLWLNIMILAYQDLEIADVHLVPNINAQRTQLFDAYINQMFNHHAGKKTPPFNRTDTEDWLVWLARKMKDHRQSPYVLERMRPRWLDIDALVLSYRFLVGLSVGLIEGICLLLLGGPAVGPYLGVVFGLIAGIYFGLETSIVPIDTFVFSLTRREKFIYLSVATGLIAGMIFELKIGLILGLVVGFAYLVFTKFQKGNRVAYPAEGLHVALKSFLVVSGVSGLIFGLVSGFVIRSTNWLVYGISFGLGLGLFLGGITLIQHFCLRLVMSISHVLPWRLLPFLNYATKLRILKREGNGYNFIHRLLLEHFAALYPGDDAWITWVD